ncbi:MAG: Rnf-Nqr domain containing protein [Oscillospiraceae bacterium]
MNIKGIRKHKSWMKKTAPILKSNSVLALGLALPFAIVPSFTLKNGVLLSILMVVATIIPVALYRIIGDGLKREFKLPISVIASMVCVSTFIYFTKEQFSTIYESIGVYAILMAVNSLMFYCEEAGKKKTVLQAVLFAFKACLGFAVVVCFISVIREILSARTVWGLPLGLLSIKMDGVAFPFFGFIALGFLSALFGSMERAISRKIISNDLKSGERNKVMHNA